MLLTGTVYFKMQDNKPQNVQDRFEFPTCNIWIQNNGEKYDKLQQP